MCLIRPIITWREKNLFPLLAHRYWWWPSTTTAKFSLWAKRKTDTFNQMRVCYFGQCIYIKHTLRSCEVREKNMKGKLPTPINGVHNEFRFFLLACSLIVHWFTYYSNKSNVYRKRKDELEEMETRKWRRFSSSGKLFLIANRLSLLGCRLCPQIAQLSIRHYIFWSAEIIRSLRHQQQRQRVHIWCARNRSIIIY